MIGQKIAELVNDRKIEGIRDVRNESSGDTTRLVIELKRDANAQVVLNQLYKHTPMQTNFPVHMLALVDGVPRLLDLQDGARGLRRPPDRGRHAAHRVPAAQGQGAGAHRRGPREGARHDRRDHRPDPRARRTSTTARAGLHGGAVRVHRDPGQLHPRHAAAAPHPARGPEAARRARRAAGDDRRSSSRSSTAPAKLDGGDQGRARRGARASTPTSAARELTVDTGDLDTLDLIDDEEVVVVLSTQGLRQDGRGRRVPPAGSRWSRACGAATCATRTTSRTCSPRPRTRTCCSSRTAAASYRLRAHEIPMKERTARGTALVNLIALEPDERIEAVIDTRTYEDGAYLFFATKNGMVKKTQDERVRLVAAHRPHRDQPAARRRAGAGDPDQRRRRHLHGVARTA